MYKMCIVLGWPAIKMQLMNSYQVEYPEVWTRISQHRIITSENLDKYYSERADEEGLLDEYQEFMHELLGSDFYTEINDTHNDLSRNIAWFLKKRNREFAIAIGIETDFVLSKSACRYQYTIEEAAEDENGPFAMYSVKADFFRKQGDSANDCLEWIKNQFKNEKEINIIDQFILDEDRNYNCLIDFVFPAIESGCKVNIHTIPNAKYRDQVLIDANVRNLRVEVFTYSEMHNRYITTSDRIIGVPLGVDFMKEREGRVVIRKPTNFTFKKKDTKRPYLEVEKELAGIFLG